MQGESALSCLGTSAFSEEEKYEPHLEPCYDPTDFITKRASWKEER